MKLEKSWHDILKDEITQPYVSELKRFLSQEKERGCEVYPPEPLIFHAFAKTPWSQVRVVIIGQDPYHGPGQAHGLSFSVPPGIPIPPSLQNIYKELEQDLGVRRPAHGCLVSWAEQGVLMLNASLTVRKGEPQSHAHRGWELFTDAVVAKIAERHEPVVFVLWGKFAQEKCQKILHDVELKHVILKAAHPSPFSAHSGFFGCRHFSKINEALLSFGSQPIDWKIV